MIRHAAPIPWSRAATAAPRRAISLATRSTAPSVSKIASRHAASAITGLDRALRPATRGPARHLSGFNFPSLGLPNRRLERLDSEAQAAPHDADAQAALYREILRVNGDPHAIISRFEQYPRVAANDDAARSYVIALTRAGLSDRVVPKLRAYLIASGASPPPGLAAVAPAAAAGLQSALYAAAGSGAGAGNASPVATLATPPGFTPDQPIYVQMRDKPEFSLKRAAWSFVRTAAWAFFLLTGVGLFFDSQGVFKIGGAGGAAGSVNPSEVDPQSMPAVRLSDVAGVDEAKHELEEIVSFLKDPQRFTGLGGKMPRGVLLTGPPGTGKTLLARAVAGEAGVPFFFMSGSEFDELYVGVGARRVRELFAAARRKSPSIIFIDELDAIGGKRNPKDQSYMRQTLNQLLVELDGFSQTEGVIVMAATNFPEMLDKALVRPGRFDKHVNVPLPDVRGRMHILAVHLKKMSVDPAVDVSVIARGTPGFSGAELANLVNQAALQASREGCTAIEHRHFEFAKDKLIMGAERKSAVITEASRKLTAFHEGGHALVAMYTEGAMPLHKATIMPRGRSLGMTVQLPEMDKDNYTKKEYMAMIDVAMGGRAAEELLFGPDNVTSGAHSDLQNATAVARKMVTELGMSEKVGLVALPDDELANMSSATKQAVEQEIKATVEQSYTRAKQLLRARKDELTRLANALIEYETLTQEEMMNAVRGKPVRP
ncbi:i-AAA protease yme1 [Blastocladiella emersonii ATCC 22665]|nr:i-AAA protease yme1 [Blastocladiella emersonii ATCC 22665]